MKLKRIYLIIPAILTAIVLGHALTANAAPNRQTQLPADGVLSVTYAANQWNITTDGKATEIKVMGPYQFIVCGNNYGEPCNVTESFASDAECVYLQFDGIPGYNSSDPYICKGPIPTESETPSWENTPGPTTPTLPTTVSTPIPTIPTIPTSTSATPGWTPTAEPPLPTQTPTPTPSATSPVSTRTTSTPQTAPTLNAQAHSRTTPLTPTATSDIRSKTSSATEANAMLPATGPEGWGFMIMGAFVLVMVGAGIIGRKKDTHDKAN